MEIPSWPVLVSTSSGAPFTKAVRPVMKVRVCAVPILMVCASSLAPPELPM